MQIYAEYGFPIGTDVHHLGQISAIHDPLICSSKGVKSVIFRIYKSIATRKHLCASEHDLEIKLKQNCHVHLGKVFALSWGSDDTFISASQDGSLCVQVPIMFMVDCTNVFSEVGWYKCA